MFLDLFQKLSSSHSVAFVTKDNKQLTWFEYYLTCTRFANSLKKYEITGSVAIMGFNTPEWFMAAVGAIMNGNIYTGIYPTNGPEEVHHVLETSEADVLVIENVQLLQKIQLKKSIKHILVYNETPEIKLYHDIPIKSFHDFCGESNTFRKISLNTQQSDVITYIMTSGTTSRSKAVSITYGNVSYTCEKMVERYNLRSERLVSYLPLSHIAASMLDIFCHFYHGGTVYFAKPDALQGSLVETLKVGRPTVFLGVPRVWEKIMEKMKKTAEQKYAGTIGGILKSIMDVAKSIALQYNDSQMNNERISKMTVVIYNICKLVFFRKIKKAIGLQECKLHLSGAAPIAKDTLNYFSQIDIVIYEIFGMSETCGVISGSGRNFYRKGSVGVPLIGEVKIADDGEILYKGLNNFIGYKGNKEATDETLDKDGWLHTGDIGTIDKDGFLYITGRKKELIITAGGENVAPVLIEQQIKKFAPEISQVIVIGDQKKFLSCLVTLPFLPNKTLATNGISADWEDKKWQEYVQLAVDKYNANPVSKAQKIQKFVILPEDVTVENECMTPTMKMKRAVIAKKFKSQIDSMYL